jgi:hypothetical protein
MGATQYTWAEINLQVVVTASAVPVRQTTEVVTTTSGYYKPLCCLHCSVSATGLTRWTAKNLPGSWI